MIDDPYGVERLGVAKPYGTIRRRGNDGLAVGQPDQSQDAVLVSDQRLLERSFRLPNRPDVNGLVVTCSSDLIARRRVGNANEAVLSVAQGVQTIPGCHVPYLHRSILGR